jgi:hypothetical protein
VKQPVRNPFELPALQHFPGLPKWVAADHSNEDTDCDALSHRAFSLRQGTPYVGFESQSMTSSQVLQLAMQGWRPRKRTSRACPYLSDSSNTVRSKAEQLSHWSKMISLTPERQRRLAMIRADLEGRSVLSPVPDDLPGKGALVRMPDGSLGQVLSWLDRNLHGKEEYSSLRIALIELIDCATPDMSDNELANQRIVPETMLTLVRSEPSDGFIKRCLSKVTGRIQ